MATKYIVTNILWDTDRDKETLTNLPAELSIDSDALGISDEDEIEETISDYLSDIYGFCHFGFSFEKEN